MQKTILITGATDGIGLELARLYKQRGERPLLLGRREWVALSHLNTEFEAADYCQADLSQPDSAEIVRQFLQDRAINQLDLLIHNAGVGYYGAIADQSAASINQLIDVNLLAPIALTQVLRPFLPTQGGQVAFISSVAAYLPAPDYAVYVATKAALDDFARNLRIEWGNSVVVQSIHPGATRTGMHAKMGISAETMNWQKFPAAEKVAAQIAKAIDGKRPAATVGLNNKILGLAGRNFGRAIDRAMQRQQPSPKGNGSPSAQKLCVITGAADGIGKALAQRYADAGYQVVGIDIDAVRAAQVANDNISFVIGDLSSAEGVQMILDSLTQPIDVLIHNAGISAVGRFEQVPLDKQRKVLDVNLRAPLVLTAGLLAKGLFRPNAAFIFISSLSKQVSYPGAVVYAASKAGLAAYARTLRVAFGGHRHVLTVYPGPTRTAHARRYSPDNSRESRRMSPEQLANLIFQAMQKKRSQLIPGFGNRVFATVGQLAPPLTNRLMKKLMLDSLEDQILVE